MDDPISIYSRGALYTNDPEIRIHLHVVGARKVAPNITAAVTGKNQDFRAFLIHIFMCIYAMVT